MKKKLLALSIVLLSIGATSNVMAQATASATASATIITPISIAKAVDMNFGTMALQAGTDGTVVITPAGTRTKTGGITLPANTGTVAAAEFTVGGEGTYTYAITLPSTYTITETEGSSETMVVNKFTSSPATTGTLIAGAQTIKVGATLNLSTDQPAGTYTNATGFDVTVNYN